jgi:hypothetical protein
VATVRVYLPTYRRPHLLGRALASLRAQTFTDWVCEVHNDNPGDPAPARLVRELADARLQLVEHPTNLGGTGTFNLFFHPTAEPFYSLLEDDNWWEPDFLATMLETARSHPDVIVFWANMRIAEELSDGSCRDTGRTIWPETGGATQRFKWADPRQAAGAVHSNGAALFRSRPGDDFRIPAVPFAIVEAVRERIFPHPLLLVRRPLATFTQTRHTERSRDPAEWAEVQAMLIATFFRDCPWSDARLAEIWDEARRQLPPATTPLLLATLADPSVKWIRGPARARDWWIVWRGFLRRPGLYFRLRESRRVHAAWWRFLETHTRSQWERSGGTRPPTAPPR